MGQKEKLIKKLMSKSKDFTFAELLRCFYENKFFPSMLKYYERKEEL